MNLGNCAIYRVIGISPLSIDIISVHPLNVSVIETQSFDLVIGSVHKPNASSFRLIGGRLQGSST